MDMQNKKQKTSAVYGTEDSAKNGTEIVSVSIPDKVSKSLMDKGEKQQIAGAMLSIGYSQSEVCDTIGIDYRTLAKWITNNEIAVNTVALNYLRKNIQASYVSKAGDVITEILGVIRDRIKNNSDDIGLKELAVTMAIIIDKIAVINGLGIPNTVNNTQVNLSFEGMLNSGNGS